MAGQLGEIRDRIIEAVHLRRHDTTLDLNAGTGLLTWEILRRTPEGGTWVVASDPAAGEALRQQASRLPEVEQPRILVGNLTELPALLEAQGDVAVRFDAIVGRNALGPYGPAERQAAVTNLARLLAEGGRLSLSEAVPRLTQRLCRLVDLSSLGADLAARVVQAEEAIYQDQQDPMVNWESADLLALFQQSDFGFVSAMPYTSVSTFRPGPAQLARWFSLEATEGRPTYAWRLLKYISRDELAQVQRLFERTLLYQSLSWQTQHVHLVGSREG